MLDSLRRHDPDQVPRVCGSSSALSAPPRRSPVFVLLSGDSTPAQGALASPVPVPQKGCAKNGAGSYDPKRPMRRIDYRKSGNQRRTNGVTKLRDRILRLLDSIPSADTLKEIKSNAW